MRQQLEIVTGAASPRPLCSKCNENSPARKSHPWCTRCLTAAKREREQRYVEEGRCKKCGEPNDTTNKVCSVCYEKYKADKRRRNRERKAAAVKLLGGKCVDCGIESPRMEIYDFHHKDPSEKSAGVAALLQNNWDVVLTELKKCELLCANCHRIREHSDEL